MRFSQLFSKTTKNVTKEADSPNAKYLLQGGFVHQILAGVYSYLPLGLRVLKKIENIIREEMNAVGGQEILMSSLNPTEAYQKTGRDALDIVYHPTENTILGFSHEEGVCPVVKNHIASYKDLPLSVYQIQTKFRNEPRAKSGILRGREFGMKDMYSFHTDIESLNAYYEKVITAYQNVYKRCGLSAYTVEASGGIFTKEYSHEFMIETDAGEDIILYCDESGVAQNVEIAKASLEALNKDEEEKEREVVSAERKTSVKANAEFHNVPEWKILKTVVYVTREEKYIGVVIRGDLDVNENKLREYLDCDIRSATDEELQKKGLVKGFISPVDNTVFDMILGDESLQTVKNFITGNNKMNEDLIHVNFQRDFEVDAVGNFYTAKEGMTCYTQKGKMREIKVVEAGNIFKLGTKYSEAFDLQFTDQDGKRKYVVMGCYGIGTTRLMGTIVEACHDKRGIIWPRSVAPYDIHLCSFGKDEDLKQKCEQLYQDLEAKGFDVLYDDRDVSPGQKLGDADLIGIPIRLLVSPRTLEKNSVEFKLRTEENAEIVLLDEVVERI